MKGERRGRKNEVGAGNEYGRRLGKREIGLERGEKKGGGGNKGKSGGKWSQ